MKFRRFTLLFFLFCYIFSAEGQTMDELNRRQDKLKEDIEMISRLINQTSSSLLSQQEKYNLLVQRRDARRELVNSLSAEIAVIDAQIDTKLAAIKMINTEIERIKTEFGLLARQAYQWKKTSSPYIYILSAQSMNQAMKRYFYIKQFEQSRKEKRNQLVELMAEVEKEKGALELSKEEKRVLYKKRVKENEKIQADINAMAIAVKELRNKRDDLEADLVEQKRAMKELEHTITKLIARESKKETRASPGLALTPEAAALARAFETNKGKLPWPVKRGFIGRKFGKQAHPTLHNLTIDNNGIDITTEPEAEVYAIFDGEVISVVYVPGYQKMIILKHGSYYSVYSHLDDIYVKKGMKVKTGTAVGTVFYDKQAEKSQIHLEIWKGKNKLNPTHWLLQD